MCQNSECKQVEEIWKRALGVSYLRLLNSIIKIIVYSAISGNHIYVYDTGYSQCFPDWHTHAYKHTHTHTHTHTHIHTQTKLGVDRIQTFVFSPTDQFSEIPLISLSFEQLKQLYFLSWFITYVLSPEIPLGKKREGEPHFWQYSFLLTKMKPIAQIPKIA